MQFTRPRHRGDGGPSFAYVLRRRVLPSQNFQLVAFTFLAVLTGLASLWAPRLVPVPALTLVIFIGGFFLRVRHLLMLFMVVGSLMAYLWVQDTNEPVSLGALLVVLTGAAVVLLFARSRERLGVQGTTGESMLVDLRDRLRAQGQIPPLPARWQVDTAFRSAYGEGFSGDFLVAHRCPDTDRLELVLVDVSGKGQAAGTRSLMLSGAFGGLMGALGPEDFLTAANAYLLRQNWDEGFATAVHVSVDLAGGTFRVACAGHPPPAHFHAGSGRWRTISEAQGPALGLLDFAEFPCFEGNLGTGDALVLYTDGMIEAPGRDIYLGVDWLVGRAENYVHGQNLSTSAEDLVDSGELGDHDDRGLVIITRR